RPTRCGHRIDAERRRAAIGEPRGGVSRAAADVEPNDATRGVARTERAPKETPYGGTSRREPEMTRFDARERRGALGRIVDRRNIEGGKTTAASCERDQRLRHTECDR